MPKALRPLVRLRRLILIAVSVSFAAALGAPRAEAIRVVSYNLLNYDNQNFSRDPRFRTVMSSMGAADVIGVQEVQDQTAMNNFLNNVLNVVEPGAWAIAPFFNDPAQSFNQGLFYRIATMNVISSDTLGNAPRDISYFTLRPVGYSSSEAEMVVFVHHFKASAGSADQATRLLEAERLRLFMNTQFSAGTNFMLIGDYNMRSSNEAAYQELIQNQANNNGRLQDPINTPGTWHNSSFYSAIHTQSPRTVNLGDGGATGGMDDRFDILLASFSLADGEGLDQLSSTYTSFGNDGNHFNLDLNVAPVIPEGQVVADALRAASDHLPVFMDLQVPPLALADVSLDFGTVIVGATADQTLNVSNNATAPADELDYTLTADAGFTAPAGSFQDDAGGGGNAHTVSMDTATEGAKAGNIAVDSDDPEDPSLAVAVSGTVLRHAVPSLATGSQTTAGVLDFGYFDEGSFTPANSTVYNLGHDSLQVLLNVYDAQITGGDGRFSVDGFSASDVADSAVFTVAFDDTGSATTTDTTYTATLVFSNRDEQGIPGATDLSDLTLTLTATVKAASTTGVDDPFMPAVTLLAANYPNPFRAGTVIRFQLNRDTPVHLSVYDVQGRRVRRLVDGRRDAGVYSEVWDGRSDAGRQVRPGIYFYRLETQDFRDTRRMTKLR